MPGLGHIAIGVAAARLHARPEARTGFPALAMIAYSALSLLPDADVVAFTLDIPYGAPFGHRGASHSIAAGLVLGLLAGLLARLWHQPWGRTTLLACLVATSHGVLDAFTDGGHGIALLWPLSEAPYFGPWRPIPVSPIGSSAVLSEWGLRVQLTELTYFAPLWLFAFWPRRARRRTDRVA
ncbi:MAG: metal-dependent hydrolase [bacterium]|nr:metal-dependent hydrolase [bacterium]